MSLKVLLNRLMLVPVVLVVNNLATIVKAAEVPSQEPLTQSTYASEKTGARCQLTFSAGYLARRGNNPTTSRGLFNGSYGALAQVAFEPNKNFGIGLTYAHSYFSGENNIGNTAATEKRSVSS